MDEIVRHYGETGLLGRIVSAVEKAMDRTMPTIADELRRFRELEKCGHVAKLKSAIEQTT